MCLLHVWTNQTTIRPTNSSQLYLKALETIHVDEGFGVEHLHDLSPRFETQHLME